MCFATQPTKKESEAWLDGRRESMRASRAGEPTGSDLISKRFLKLIRGVTITSTKRRITAGGLSCSPTAPMAKPALRARFGLPQRIRAEESRHNSIDVYGRPYMAATSPNRSPSREERARRAAH